MLHLSPSPLKEMSTDSENDDDSILPHGVRGGHRRRRRRPQSPSISTTSIGDISAHLDRSTGTEHVLSPGGSDSVDGAAAVGGVATVQYEHSELCSMSAQLTNYYDMLMFYWYYIFGQDWIRGLMASDCEHTLSAMNSAIVLKDSLNDYALGTADLYEAYHDRLEALSDAKFVFEAVQSVADSESLFQFRSFSAHILFVVCKLDLFPFFDGRPLPRQFQRWRAIVVDKMDHYLSAVLRLDAHSHHMVRMHVLCPGSAQVVAPRTYSLRLMHRALDSYPDEVPIVLDPNTFGRECPIICIDMRHPRAVRLLNAFRTKWASDRHFKARDALQFKADTRWPRVDRPAAQAAAVRAARAQNQRAKRSEATASPWTSPKPQSQQNSKCDDHGHEQNAWKRSLVSRMGHNPYAVAFQQSQHPPPQCPVEPTHSGPLRVCRFWARSGRCKWGDQCYDLHHGMMEQMESIERTATAESKESDDIASTNYADSEELELSSSRRCTPSLDEAVKSGCSATKQREGAVAKVDEGLAIYYRECGRTDYVNNDGVGKFAEFMERRGHKNEEAVGQELGDGACAGNCSFLAMDDDFPLSRDYESEERRNETIFKVFQFCFRWSSDSKKGFVRELQRNFG